MTSIILMKSTEVQNTRRILLHLSLAPRPAVGSFPGRFSYGLGTRLTASIYANARARKLGTPAPCAAASGRDVVRNSTHAHYLYLMGWVNVVLDDAGFSIPNGVFLAKSPHYFSSACCARAVGIAHEPVLCL